jgi:hypothetical protein
MLDRKLIIAVPIAIGGLSREVADFLQFYAPTDSTQMALALVVWESWWLWKQYQDAQRVQERQRVNAPRNSPACAPAR